MHLSSRNGLTGAAAIALAVGLAVPAVAQNVDGHYGFGDPAPQDLIEEWAIAIPPDGEHLPPGGATAAEGESVYMEQCAVCHGENLEGVEGTGGDPLVGGRNSLAENGEPAKKTVESYWPYATTVFDFVRRTMPFTEPGSLTDEEVYAVTAYILHRGDIIAEDEEMNAETLPQVEMPNRDGFIPDPRPDVHDYQ